jgi:hypothetical protein
MSKHANISDLTGHVVLFCMILPRLEFVIVLRQAGQPIEFDKQECHKGISTATSRLQNEAI